MTNTFYTFGLEGICSCRVNFGADIRVALVESGYVFDIDHDYLDHVNTYITSSTQRSSALAFTCTDGVVYATDKTLSSVATGKSIVGIVIYAYASQDANCPLIIYNDEADGLPLTTDGTNVNVLWDDEGLFSIEGVV